MTTVGDAVPLELDDAALADHECHIAWCQPRPVDGLPQSQSHSGGVCSIGQLADKALAAKASLLVEMGVIVHLCGEINIG